MTGANLKAKTELKEKREAMCSQNEMASLISAKTGSTMARSYYGHIETGERLVSAELALVIARILKADVNELFTNGESK